MNKKLLAGLLVCSLITAIIGNGSLPLMPVYAVILGAGKALSGYYLALAYLALAAGTYSAAWFLQQFPRPRTVLITSILLNLPLVWLFQYITAVWHLIVLTMITWFIGGLFGAVVSIVAGLAADENERGRIFGLLGLTGPLGTLLGGLIFGPIVDRWGYAAAFLFIFLLELALPLASLPVTGIFIPKRTSSQARHASPNLSSGFFLLIGTTVLTCSGGFIGTIGISLTMHGRGFPASSISLVAAIGGLIALPLPYLIGRLSDRVGRRMLLSTSYLTGMFGLLTLTFANVFGLFALASSFNNIRAFVSSGLAQALVTDLAPKESLSRAMSLYQSFVWVGGIIGFALSGVLFQAIGQRATFITAAAIILIAIGLVSRIHLRSPHVAPA